MEIDIILKMVLAAVLGGIIGLEQEISQRNSGLQGPILIAVGTTLFTALSFKIPQLVQTADPMIMASPIVIAAGLIGAAIVMRSRFTGHGVISAAITWITIATGILVGCGYYLLSFLVTLFAVLIMAASKRIAMVMEAQNKLYAYLISTEDQASILIEIKKVVTELAVKSVSAHLKKTTKGYQIEVTFNTSKNKNREFVEKVMQLPGVKEITSEYL